MARLSGLVVATSLSLICAAPALAQEPGRLPATPIAIEAGDMDACPSNAVVQGLDPAGDGFLSVRSSPGSKNPELDRLHEGDPVFVCTERGDWLGVVYTRAGRECGVTSPWSASQVYTGPCRSGWVHRNWISITAG
jgi:DNA-binding beta-propeller fold protein YncE